jgi:adenine-specific DNA methylase
MATPKNQSNQRAKIAIDSTRGHATLEMNELYPNNIFDINPRTIFFILIFKVNNKYP